MLHEVQPDFMKNYLAPCRISFMPPKRTNDRKRYQADLCTMYHLSKICAALVRTPANYFNAIKNPRIFREHRNENVKNFCTK